MEDKPNEIKAQPAVLQMTIQIKRAATGKVEEYTLTGATVEDKPPEAEVKKEQ